MWILFASGSALFAGITAILAKIGIKDTDSHAATALRCIIILVFSWIMVFFTGSYQDIRTIEGRTLLFLVLSGGATGASWLCYFKALQLGSVNKVAPVDKSSTLLTMLLAFLILGEPLGLLKLLGMTAIGAGTMLMVTGKKTASPETNSSSGTGWLIYAGASAIFASLTAILGKIGITGISANLGTAIRNIIVLVMAWIVLFLTGKQGEIKKAGSKSLLFITLSGLSTGLSWLCYYKALQDGPASIVVPIDKLSILITIAFSRLILKESLTKQAFFGLILITCGTLSLLLP